MKNQIVIVVPLRFAFNTSPEELEGRQGEVKATKKSLIEYLEKALTLEIDVEGEGQPEGSAFGTAVINWREATSVRT